MNSNHLSSVACRYEDAHRVSVRTGCVHIHFRIKRCRIAAGEPSRTFIGVLHNPAQVLLQEGVVRRTRCSRGQLGRRQVCAVRMGRGRNRYTQVDAFKYEKEISELLDSPLSDWAFLPEVQLQNGFRAALWFEFT